MWRDVEDVSVGKLTINQEQIVAINEDDKGHAVLMMADGSSVIVGDSRDALKKKWGINVK